MKAIEMMDNRDHPNFLPQIEQIEGGQRFTIRIKRKAVDSRSVKTASERKEQTSKQSGLGVKNPSYKRDSYNYKTMLPEVGSPDSIQMGTPKLEVAIIRHLKHDENVVDPIDVEGFRARFENLFADLMITDKTIVFLIPSSTSQMDLSRGNMQLHSRTEDTAKAIANFLDEKGINYVYNNIDDAHGVYGSTTLQVREGLREYAADEAVFAAAERKFQENMEAKKSGKPLPHPAPFNQPPSVYASYASSVKDLQEHTGIEEMSSASVARGLSAIDALEFYFLKQGNMPQGADKVVVILVGHGQFATDMSEAMEVATNDNFPIIYAGNGAYWRMNIGQNPQGEIVEEWVVETGNKTGMQEVQ